MLIYVRKEILRTKGNVTSLNLRSKGNITFESLIMARLRGPRLKLLRLLFLLSHIGARVLTEHLAPPTFDFKQHIPLERKYNVC